MTFVVILIKMKYLRIHNISIHMIFFLSKSIHKGGESCPKFHVGGGVTRNPDIFCICLDDTERYDFLSRILLLHSPFLFPPKKRVKRKGE